MPTSLPVRYEMTVYAGATFRKLFRWLPDGENPQDFTGWQAALLIGTGRSTLSMDTQSGHIELTPGGEIHIVIPADETAEFPDDVWSYQFDLISPDGDVVRFLRGRLEIVVDVKP